MKKNSFTPISPKKYSCYGLKKIHTRNLITKKIPADRKFPTPAPLPPPPHNFSNDPSLSMKRTKNIDSSAWTKSISSEVLYRVNQFESTLRRAVDRHVMSIQHIVSFVFYSRSLKVTPYRSRWSGCLDLHYREWSGIFCLVSALFSLDTIL